MAYSTLPQNQIGSGLPLTNGLLDTIRTNFDDIAARLTPIETDNTVISSVEDNTQSTAFSFASTNLIATIATTGRPVLMMLAPTQNVLGANIVSTWIGSGAANCITYFQLTRDGTPIGLWRAYKTGLGGNFNHAIPPGCITYIDLPAPGSHTYAIQVKGSTGSEVAGFQSTKMILNEL